MKMAAGIIVKVWVNIEICACGVEFETPCNVSRYVISVRIPSVKQNFVVKLNF